MLKLSLRDLRAHVGRYVLTFLAVDHRRRVRGRGHHAHRHDRAHARRPVRRAQPRHRRGRARRRPVRARPRVRRRRRSGPASRPSWPTRWPRSTGVAAAEGYLQGFTRPIGPDGVPYGNPTFGFPTIGTNWGVVDELNPFDIVRGPRAPRARTRSRSTSARSTRPATRSATSPAFQTASGVSSAQIVGVARFGTSDSPGGASITLFDNDTAQMLLAGPGEVDQIVECWPRPGSRRRRPGTRWPTPSPAGDVEVVTGDDAHRGDPGHRAGDVHRGAHVPARVRPHLGAGRDVRDLHELLVHRGPAAAAGGPAAGHRRRAGPGADLGGARVAGRRGGGVAASATGSGRGAGAGRWRGRSCRGR